MAATVLPLPVLPLTVPAVVVTPVATPVQVVPPSDDSCQVTVGRGNPVPLADSTYWFVPSGTGVPPLAAGAWVMVDPRPGATVKVHWAVSYRSYRALPAALWSVKVAVSVLVPMSALVVGKVIPAMVTPRNVPVVVAHVPGREDQVTVSGSPLLALAVIASVVPTRIFGVAGQVVVVTVT